MLYLVRGIIQIQDYYEYSGTLFRVISLSDIRINTSYLRPAIFLLIPTIGIFLQKKIGWVLMISYFYFLLTNILYPFTMDYDKMNDYRMMLFYILISGVVALLVIIMNKKSIHVTKYDIQREKLILYNIIAFTIGISLTIYLTYARG